MEAKLTLPKELIEEIADRVIEKILPYLQLQSPPPDEILNAKEVSKFLGTSEGQIYQWVHNSTHGLMDFPFLKAGKRLKFSKNEILHWMKNNRKRLENR